MLSATEVHGLRTACYDIDPSFGRFTETIELTGTRPSQAAQLNVEDLLGGAAPVLLVPTSLKGRRRNSTARSTRVRKPVPIPAYLAASLAAAAAGRPRGAPLLPRPDDARWCSTNNDYANLFARAAASVGLDAAIYALRHTRITEMLLKECRSGRLPLWSTARCRRSSGPYSRHIGLHSNSLIRAALFKDSVPAPEGNVVPLTARRGLKLERAISRVCRPRVALTHRHMKSTHGAGCRSI